MKNFFFEKKKNEDFVQSVNNMSIYIYIYIYIYKCDHNFPFFLHWFTIQFNVCNCKPVIAKIILNKKLLINVRACMH